MEELTDIRGKWLKEGLFKTLVEPSGNYLESLEQERLNNLLMPAFKEPNVSNLEIQMANFILDVAERLDKLEGGNS